MRRLEIIHLRMASECPTELIEDIRRSIEGGRELESCEIYRHATVTSDLGIHLNFEIDSGDTDPSELGIRLADSLRELGMVEHTLWVKGE